MTLPQFVSKKSLLFFLPALLVLSACTDAELDDIVDELILEGPAGQHETPTEIKARELQSQKDSVRAAGSQDGANAARSGFPYDEEPKTPVTREHAAEYRDGYWRGYYDETAQAGQRLSQRNAQPLNGVKATPTAGELGFAIALAESLGRSNGQKDAASGNGFNANPARATGAKDSPGPLDIQTNSAYRKAYRDSYNAQTRSQQSPKGADQNAALQGGATTESTDPTEDEAEENLRQLFIRNGQRLGRLYGTQDAREGIPSDPDDAIEEIFDDAEDDGDVVPPLFNIPAFRKTYRESYNAEIEAKAARAQALKNHLQRNPGSLPSTVRIQDPGPTEDDSGGAQPTAKTEKLDPLDPHTTVILEGRRLGKERATRDARAGRPLNPGQATPPLADVDAFEKTYRETYRLERQRMAQEKRAQSEPQSVTLSDIQKQIDEDIQDSIGGGD